MFQVIAFKKFTSLPLDRLLMLPLNWTLRYQQSCLSTYECVESEGELAVSCSLAPVCLLLGL